VRVGDHAIELESEDSGLATGDGSDCQMFGGVVEQVGIELRDVGDPFPIGRP